MLFVLIPGLSVVAPLLAYPAVTHRYGSDGFAAIAIGQSLGTTVAIVCELGWSVTGPQAAARGADINSLHRASVASKVLALAVGAPLAFALAYLLSTEHKVAAALTAALLSFTALSPTWLLTGLNRPSIILLVDVFPRMILSALLALSIYLGAPLWIFGIPGFLATVLSIVLAARFIGYGVVPTGADFSAAPRTLWSQIPLTAGRSVSVAYTSLVTSIVGVLSPGAVPLYAGADRILRMGLAVLAGVPARLQSWVGSAQTGQRRRRSNASLLTNALLGIVAAGVFLVAAQPAADLLFSRTIIISETMVLLAACVAFLVCASRGFGLSLVAEDRANAIAVASLSAAAVGLVVAFLAIPAGGAVGAMIAVASAEATGLFVQAVALFSRRGPENTWMGRVIHE